MLSIIGYLLSLAFHVLIAIAIYLDATENNIQKSKKYGVLGFFFPLIVGIIYAIKRKNLATDEVKSVKKSVVVCIIAIVLFICSVGATVFGALADKNSMLGAVLSGEVKYDDLVTDENPDTYGFDFDELEEENEIQNEN